VSAERILVIGAHSADFVWRAGGALAVCTSTGGSGRVIALSYGERGESGELWKEDGQTIENVKRVRHAEAERAAEALGADFHCLDLGDYPLQIDTAALEQISEVLNRVAASESIEVDEGAVAMVARSASGSFRDALGTLDQLVAFGGSPVELSSVLEMLGAADAELLFEAVDAVVAEDPKAVLLGVERMARSGRDPLGSQTGVALLQRREIRRRQARRPQRPLTDLRCFGCRFDGVAVDAAIRRRQQWPGRLMSR